MGTWPEVSAILFGFFCAAGSNNRLESAQRKSESSVPFRLMNRRVSRGEWDVGFPLIPRYIRLGSLTAPLRYAPFAHKRYASIHSALAGGGFGSGRSRIGID